jgi:topoisomerase IV subunit A
LIIEKFNIKKVISAVYWDGQSKQHFVKRFKIETATPDKDFNFISEGIGSRLEFVSSKDSPEVEIELAKGKSKETEVINLEDIIDVKGWKALGNRLSQHKVTKVRSTEEPEESGSAADDDEVTESKDSQSPKKKEEPSQPQLEKEPNLFQQESQPAKKENQQQSQQKPQQKKQAEKVNQPNLFGENESKKSETPKVSKPKDPKPPKDDGKSFGVGETIELDL